ncbi:MAG: DUF58 domain-containing protein [Planctomycetota bacterium]|nr:MAG: DUF58 domain-containing protein [Planctomycetota bacterium]
MEQTISNEELKSVLKEVRQIQVRTGKIVSDVMAGEYHSVFKGRGMEFEDVREYQMGDDVRNIDWNVTARMNHPYIKNFREERELTVMILVDISASSGFGTTGFSKANIIAKICATLAFSAIQNNDKVGLILFSDVIEKYIPPKKGSNHVLRVIRELLVSAKILETEPLRKATNINVALEHLNKLHKRRGVCFLVSDFISEDFETDLRIVSKRHEIIAISVSDPREIELPPLGLIELEDAETGEVILVDTSDPAFLKSFHENIEIEMNSRKDFFRSLKIDYLEINTGNSFENSLISFFSRRSKK